MRKNTSVTDHINDVCVRKPWSGASAFQYRDPGNEPAMWIFQSLIFLINLCFSTVASPNVKHLLNFISGSSSRCKHGWFQEFGCLLLASIFVPNDPEGTKCINMH